MSVLQELYRGEVQPSENTSLITQELSEARSGYLRREEKLLEKVDEPLRGRIRTLLEERAEVAAFEIEDAYIRGMRMGAQLTTELLAKKDRPILP